MKSSHYIIHRVNLDIEAPDVQTARRMQDDAVRIFNNWITPNLEDLLAGLIPDDVVLHLDTLDLSLDVLESTDFELEFGEAFLNSFQEKIKQVVAAVDTTVPQDTEEPVTTMKKEQRDFSIFLYFIQTGQLAWWCEKETQILEEEFLITMLKQQSRQGSEMIPRLLSLLASETLATTRLFLQFSPHFIHTLITILLGRINWTSKEKLNREIEEFLQKLSEDGQVTSTLAINSLREIFEVILSLESGLPLSTSDVPSDKASKYIENNLQQLGQRDLHSSDQSVENITEDRPSQQLLPTLKEFPDNEESITKGIYVDHAGLVLLHPFLEYFFREFNLLNDKEFCNSSTRDLGIHLLNYLATGLETQPEYLLTFEKFLCGADLLAPIPRYISLTDQMKEESDKLLLAAIGHWKALKNSSPDGLREGFIQRSGKIIRTDFESRLIVEGKGQDVLLNYLPWGYGIIKLPWLNTPLFVDWVN